MIPARTGRLVVCLLLALAAAMLAGCGDDVAPPTVETVTRVPLVLDVIGEGPLQSAKATPLLVPGQGWAQRQLVWMRDEGSRVEEGEVLARFSTERGELDLAEARVDLERNALARAAKQAELTTGQGRVAVDLSKVAMDLSIAERYAGADLSTMARNDVLDAIQDVDYLGAKRDTLRWKQGQSSERGAAELAVLDAQRATVAIEAERSRKDLEALELRAPHAGVMMLTADWSGEKPTIGSSLRPGSELGRLPDTSTLEVELAMPQIQAQGVAVGNMVELSPVGRPGQQVTSTISWVASAAKVMSRNSPVKYLTMKATVPAEAARKHGWVPGQKLRARVVLFEGQAMSVANIALRSEAGRHYVQVRGGEGFARRQVEIGVRGSARSQVLEGLSPGDEVLLVDGGTAADAIGAIDPEASPGTDPAGGNNNSDDSKEPGS
ncbi:efflux RND transporter periplasmic adaptor subunit [Novilysobacter spongiicola]|uniref:HlyD family secretion protein n=1 Tax=Lysobacter spongiicola DSM 21749 TaxID=1122188 RepID=A0A1T4RR40_9GAMM|nr:efflux RND transporter periplasmic adaptor subunit [Lysobacter spongiicola]SKA18347.1 HlyD family secretion protein [Lysobacter spongiicola DSM 21749]